MEDTVLIRQFMLFFAITVFCVVPLQANDAVFPFPVHQSVLDNGLTVISIPFDSPGIIAYYTVVRTGSRNEVEEGLSGFAHFFEHMMFRGTEQYSAEEYNEVLKRLGADHNAFTTDDWTGYHVVASADALEDIVRIESDRFMNLKYSVEDFKTEAGAILGEYNMNAANPVRQMFERMREMAFSEHTYGHTTLGYIEDIKDMPNQFDYSLTFFDRYYRPEYCTIIVAGDVKHDRLIELAEKYYSGWEPGTWTVDIPVEPPQTEEKRSHITWGSATLPHLMIGYRVPEFDETNIDIPALNIIGQLLFARNAPLFQKLVVDEQLVDFVSGGYTDRRDPYLITIMSRIKNVENVERVEQDIYDAIEDLKNNQIAPERLDEIKSFLRYSFAMSLHTASSVAQTVSHYIQLTGDFNTVNQLYNLFNRVTPEDVQRVAQKYFTPATRSVVTLAQEEVQQ
jgi:zinc protease